MAFSPDLTPRRRPVLYLLRRSDGTSVAQRQLFSNAIMALAPQANAGELRRMSCTVVRFYVAKYSAPAAEAWARNKGATDAEIEAARRCIKDSPIQTASDMSATSR